MPRELDFESLRLCLDNYSPSFLFIRDCGGVREDGKYDPTGRVKVRERLEGRILDFRKDHSGLYLLVDSAEVFHFPLNGYNLESTKGFSLAYERVESNGAEIHLSTGINPYDKNLPEPRTSTLRTVLDNHLMEIDFLGRINLKFHSWWIKPYWKYWTIAKPGSIPETIYKQQDEYSEEDS